MSKDNLENYKPIPNYSRYLISESGDVWNISKHRHVKPLKKSKALYVQIVNDNLRRAYVGVHTLVYRTFVDSELPRKVALFHIDGDTENNHFTNINREDQVGRTREKDKFKYQTLGIRTDRKIQQNAYTTWKGMMRRCYTPNDASFRNYGGKGVEVCDLWKDFKKFEEWYLANSVYGWVIDKDFLGDSKTYSPENCVFIPQSLNSLVVYSDRGNTVEKYVRGTYALRTYVASHYVVFKGESEEDCMEQLELTRKLQLEKILFLMKEQIRKTPNSPEIDPRVIHKLRELIA